MALEIFFKVFGGLAVFLYGMVLMSSGLQKVAGDKLQKILEQITKGKLRGILAGATATAIVQSSSLVTVTVLAFINSGLLNFNQAVGLIMGANIGTTITAQLVAFNVETFYFSFIILGFCLNFLAKKRELKYLGSVILGFGILFLGMDLMGQGIYFLRNNPWAINFFSNFSKNPLLGIIAGAVFTGIIQSSSATSGLVIVLGRENIINLPAAIALILGANIGTCATALIASFGSTKNAKRAAVFHLFLNITGVAYFLPFINYFAILISRTSFNISRQIANAHTFFNVFNTFVFLFISGFIVKLIEKMIPMEEQKIEKGTIYLDKHLVNIPAFALTEAQKEITRMIKITLPMIEAVEKIVFSLDKNSPQKNLQLKGDNKILKSFPPVYKSDLLNFVYRQEDEIDNINRQIEKYLRLISEKDLSKDNSQMLSGLLHANTDIERIGDHLNNLAENAQILLEKKLFFSYQASIELLEIFEAVKEMLKKGIRAFSNYDKKEAEAVLTDEPKIDKLREELHQHHLERLEKGICNGEAGIIFEDIIRNLERIGDHLDNIGHMILTGF